MGIPEKIEKEEKFVMRDVRFVFWLELRKFIVLA